MKRFACGSQEFGSPPFPFPPPGASRGHTATRYARAGESAGKMQSRLLRLMPVRQKGSLVGGYAAPKPPLLGGREPRTLCCKPDISLANKTGHLDVLTTVWPVMRSECPVAIYRKSRHASAPLIASARHVDRLRRSGT